MVNKSMLMAQSSTLDFREVALDTWKVLVPFYHEDGDMYEMFVQPSPEDEAKIRLTDFGLTLMRLSYTFDIDTTNKTNILQSIISQNKFSYKEGLIFADIAPERFYAAVNTFAQVISKVMNMDIISKEIAKSFFYEILQDFMINKLDGFSIKKDHMPISNEPDHMVDFVIEAKKPIYLFGVKDDTKAGKVVISCLHFNNKSIPHRSLIVPESMDSLTKYYQRQIINFTDKQFYSLDDFTSDGASYLRREIA